ncbi:MAG: magnesium transporter [Ruminococcus sp.]|nr:magnesium transporter [Ruminococcus sp.]
MLYDTIIRLLEKRNFKVIKEIFENMNEADIADLFGNFHDNDDVDKKDFPILFRLLPKDAAADVFAYMDTDMQEMLINSFTDKELAEIIDDLFIDDTVDIVEEMPANVVSRILKAADSETRKQINQILKYPKDSAGSIMTTEYVYLNKDMTVNEAIAKIRQVGVVKETVYTLYVTENRRLIGVLSVLDILTADDDDRIEDIMETNVITVDTLEDRELVAQQFEKYDFLALPVVDKEQRIVGIVTFDDAMDVMREENTEDFSHMAGMAPIEDSYFKTSVFSHARNRIAWLLVLMLSATLTGAIITKYESAFAAVPLLVSFIPMLTGTGGNCGSQTSTMIIRGMSLGEINLKDWIKVAFKEFRIALIVSVILALVNGIRIYVTYAFISPGMIESPLKLAVTVSLAIISTVIMSKLIGCMLPMLAKRLHLDPALMAAPLISTIVDTCTTLVFFNIAMVIFDIHAM